MSVDRVDAALDALANKRFADADEGLAALAEATGLVNANLIAPAGDPMRVTGIERRRDVLTGSAWTLRSDAPERLRRWIVKLRAAASSIAQQSGASAYSVSISFPAGVSVGVEWSVERRAFDRRVDL
jgi:hypothetical protein